jgi:hypothetical protein
MVSNGNNISKWHTVVAGFFTSEEDSELPITDESQLSIKETDIDIDMVYSFNVSDIKGFITVRFLDGECLMIKESIGNFRRILRARESSKSAPTNRFGLSLN